MRPGGAPGRLIHNMSATTKIAVGVASGYLLGRTKKLRLAVTVAGLLAGQRMAANRGTLLQQGGKLLDSSPELKQLRDQITGRLLDTAKDAALGVATSRVQQMTKSLQAPPTDDEAPEDEAPEDEAPEDEAPDEGDEDEAPDEGDEPRSKTPAKKAAKKTAKKASGSRSRGSSAAKSSTRRTPAKKASSSRRGRSSQGAKG